MESMKQRQDIRATSATLKNMLYGMDNKTTIILNNITGSVMDTTLPKGDYCIQQNKATGGLRIRQIGGEYEKVISNKIYEGRMLKDGRGLELVGKQGYVGKVVFNPDEQTTITYSRTRNEQPLEERVA